MKSTIFYLFFMLALPSVLLSQSEIKTLYEAGKYETILKQVEKKDTTIRYSGDDLYLIARSYQRQNYCSPAIAYFDKALKAGNDSAKTHFFKGVCFATDKDYANAIECFTEAIKRDSSDEENWLLRGKCYMYSEKIDAAIADLSKSIALVSEGNTAAFMLMYAFYLKGDFKQSEATYKKYQPQITKSDYNISAQSLLGEIERDVHKNCKKAIPYFEKVLQNDSLELKAYEDVLICYTRLESWKKVDDLFNVLKSKKQSQKLHEKYAKRTAAVVEKFLFNDTSEVVILRYFKKPEKFAEPIYQAYISHTKTDSTLFMVKTEKSLSLEDNKDIHMICAWVGRKHMNYGAITDNGEVSYATFKKALMEILKQRIKPVAGMTFPNQDKD